MQISRENLKIARQLDRHSAAPEGWRKLGTGSSRTAFLAPDGLVYKITDRDDTYQNHHEVKAVWAWRKRDLPDWCIIPRAYLDPDTEVLVMEYHEGTQPKCDRRGCECGLAVCWTSRLTELVKLGWADRQCANAVLTPEGNVVIIDLGCN
jgi:hypothetical protein